MKKTIFAAMLAALGMSTAAFADVQIGVVNSLSGPFAAFGERYRIGMELAVEEINASGGIGGEPLSLIVQDDRSEAQSALAAVEQLSRQDVPMIIGSYASSITGPMAQLMTRQRIPLLVLGSADDSITNPGSDWVFRAKHNSTIVASTYFDFFDWLNTKEGGDDLSRVAMLYGNGAWPTSLAERGKEIAAERGYEVVGDQAYDQGVTDFRPMLNGFLAAQPDILYIVSYAEDGVAITRQMREVGLSAEVIAIDTSAALPSFPDQVGDLANYIATVVSWSKDVQYEGAHELSERIEEKTGREPSFYEAEGYLAVRVAADALTRAGSTDRTAVRDALSETDIETPVSTVRFEEEGGFKNQNPIRSLVLQIQDGQHVTVFPEDLAAEPVMFPAPAWDAR